MLLPFYVAFGFLFFWMWWTNGGQRIVLKAVVELKRRRRLQIIETEGSKQASAMLEEFRNMQLAKGVPASEIEQFEEWHFQTLAKEEGERIANERLGFPTQNERIL